VLGDHFEVVINQQFGHDGNLLLELLSQMISKQHHFANQTLPNHILLTVKDVVQQP
jgi:hypothetical protein